MAPSLPYTYGSESAQGGRLTIDGKKVSLRFTSIYMTQTEIVTRTGIDASWAAAAEQQARTSAVDNTTNRIMAFIFQRDGMEETQRSSQSLQVYAADGTPINPAVGEYRKQFYEQVHTLVRNTSYEFSAEEWSYMTMVVPELVGALVLTENHIDRVYQEDLYPLVQVAVDWFKHPDAVDKTHIRVGYGGETVIGARAPVYIKPALETMEQVRYVFSKHRNWALFRALRAQIGVDKGPEMDAFVANHIRSIVGSRNGRTSLSAIDGEVLQELNEYSHTSPDELHPVLEEMWEHFGVDLEYESLQRRFHFSEKNPTLVVFNGAEAAIRINHKDVDQTREARDKTQLLLRTYIAEFHPALRESVVFQNDVPWEDHTYMTSLVIMYARDLIYQANGGLDEVNQRLARFAHHHASGEAQSVYGMPGHIAYAALHFLFFEDRQEVQNNAEKLPLTNVMESIHVPRNVLYHQGPPEVVFGEYRKLVSKTATRSDFVEWLTRRHQAGEIDKVALGRAIWDKAQKLMEQPARRGGVREIRGSLLEVTRASFEEWVKVEEDGTVRGALKQAEKQIQSYLASERFKEADDKEAAYGRLLEMFLMERPSESPEVIRAVITEVQAEQQRMYDTMFEVSKAWTAGDGSVAALMQDESTQGIYYPWMKAELTLRVGDIPAYYILEGVDQSVWPEYQTPSLQNYRDCVERAGQQELRLKQITGFGEKIAKKELGLKNGNGKEDKREFPEAVAGILQASFQEDVHAVADMYMEVDRILAEGSGTREETDAAAERVAVEGVGNIIRRTRQQLSEYADGDDTVVTEYIQMYVIPILTEAKKQVLGEVAARLFQVGAVLRDYQLLLADIHPDEQQAEQTYNEFTQRVLYQAQA